MLVSSIIPRASVVFMVWVWSIREFCLANSNHDRCFEIAVVPRPQNGCATLLAANSYGPEGHANVATGGARATPVAQAQPVEVDPQVVPPRRGDGRFRFWGASYLLDEYTRDPERGPAVGAASAAAF